MTNLTAKQMQLLDALNQTRLSLTQIFKESAHPDAQAIFTQLLRLQVVLMENKYTEHLQEFIQQNHANLGCLINQLMVKNKRDPKRKKFDVKWRQQTAPKQKHQELSFKQFKSHENKVESNRFKNNSVAPITPVSSSVSREINSYQGQPQLPSFVKSLVPAGEFMSANSLPKGTSVRKKFVPPYKKPQAPLKQVNEKLQEDEQCTDPQFRHLEGKLVNIILSQILQKKQKIEWNSIAGLGFAKKLIHEMIVWPMLRPDIFTGLRAPPRAILLFGPPGTGKTMIGRAIASQAAATFFSISASSLTSKWVGQSQKLVKTLFAIARAKQPSVIFIDQIDSLLCSRSEGEQESSRRVKTEFLVELDGAKTTTSQRVLIIGATNLPKELDDAVRRRFVKRLYIPLPNFQGRSQLLLKLTTGNAFRLNSNDIQRLSHLTKGFSGADLYTLCSQAALMPLREMDEIQNVRYSEVPVSELKHFENALKLVRPSVNKKMLKSFEDFNEQYGSYQFSPDELQQVEEDGHRN